jgi:hypothetical protein
LIVARSVADVPDAPDIASGVEGAADVTWIGAGAAGAEPIRLVGMPTGAKLIAGEGAMVVAGICGRGRGSGTCLDAASAMGAQAVSVRIAKAWCASLRFRCLTQPLPARIGRPDLLFPLIILTNC